MACKEPDGQIEQDGPEAIHLLSNIVGSIARRFINPENRGLRSGLIPIQSDQLRCMRTPSYHGHIPLVCLWWWWLYAVVLATVKRLLLYKCGFASNSYNASDRLVIQIPINKFATSAARRGLLDAAHSSTRSIHSWYSPKRVGFGNQVRNVERHRGN